MGLLNSGATFCSVRIFIRKLAFYLVIGDITATLLAFLTIWALGSLFMFGIWFIRLRTNHQGLVAAGVKEREALDRVNRRLRLSDAVEIVYSDRLKEPALLGIFRQTVIVPTGLSDRLTEAEFESVLLHELAHARRRDNLTSAFVHSLVSIFWFHPLLWFAERRLIAERERACDEAVIRYGTAPEVYLAGLAKVCRFCLFGNVAGVSAAGGSNLSARFDQILSYRLTEPIPYLVRILLTSLTVLITLLPIAGGYCEQCGTGRQALTKRVKDRAVSHYDRSNRSVR